NQLARGLVSMLSLLSCISSTAITSCFSMIMRSPMSQGPRSHLHTAVECRSPSTRAVLGRRHNGRFLLVSAIAIRHNGSQVLYFQVPSETLPTASPVLEASIPSTIVMDPASINTQPITEQVFEAAPTVVDVLQGVQVELTNVVGETFESFSRRSYPELLTISDPRLIPPLSLFPVFIFIALRKTSYLPVPSMQTGGCLWFLDPFYILPIAVTGTRFAILEVTGVDNPNLKAMKTVFRITRFVILTINFPTVVFTYWLTSNCFSLAQVALLKHPLVRQNLRIPERIKHPVSALPQNEGFIDTIKKGGCGPLGQTFTHNPLQLSTPSITATTTKSAKAKQAAPATGGKKRPREETND
uniref:OXA1L mitochondrial inner membrane protein n=1 Tax=Oncorhynchus mykiss TaxID=8022 RepID=A0A8C7Q106_ONCMY